jgi:NAD(P)-dependent dehydrogenase (short-subunit alcohol dehydrogenase family)
MSKVILLTGATDGLGAYAAEMLARAGHHLLIHGRDQARLSALAEKLSMHSKIETFCCDLSSLRGVAQMADEVLSDHQHIDVLINNAGVLRAEACRTDEGLELRFVVNAIAPYLLTQRLLAAIPHGGRVVNLSSAAQASLTPKALGRFDDYSDMEAYSKSKMAITAWTRQMALAHGDKIFVAVNPASLLGTKMVKEGFGIDGSDISVGADIICRAALSDEFSAANGLYYDNDAKCFAPPHQDALDEAIGAAIIAQMSETIEAIVN